MPFNRPLLAALLTLNATLFGLTAAVLAADSYADQRAKLESLSAEEKEQLQRKKERFDALPAAEQDRLRKLHDEIATTPESAELLAVMTRYNEWLKTISSAVRAELLSLPPDERIKRIKEIKHEQERQRFRQFASQVPEDDMNIIYVWLGEYVERHKDELEKRISHDFRRRYDQMRDDGDRRTALIRSFVLRPPGDDSAQLSKEEADSLIARLSEETRREIDRANTAEEKTTLVKTLLRATVLSKMFPPISDEQRQAFFAKLSSVERERLEQMDPHVMRRELTRMYYTEQFRNRDGQRWGPSPPPGGDPRFGPGRRDDGRGPGRREGRDNRRGPDREGPDGPPDRRGEFNRPIGPGPGPNPGPGPRLPMPEVPQPPPGDGGF